MIRAFDRWLLADAPAERLAVLRIAISGYSFIYIVANVGEFVRLANRSTSEFEPVGLASVLTSPVTPAVLWSVFAILIVSSIAALFGVWFRVTGPVLAFAFLAWASYHSSWGQMLHFEHVVTLHLLVLAASPASESLSVDARMRTRQVASVRFGWPIRLMAIITVVTYSLAAIAKLRIGGSSWIDGSTLANHIAYSATRLDLLGEPRPPFAAFAVQRDWLLGPAAIGGVAVELFAPLALFGGWFRKLWIPAIVTFHLATLLTMLVFFPYNGLGLALLPLYRVERILQVRGHVSNRRNVTTIEFRTIET